MPSCPDCQADLPEPSARCAQCGAAPPDAGVRRIVFPTRKVLQKLYETLVVERGLLLRSAEPLPEGAELRLQLVLPEEAGTLNVAARVVGTREAPAGKGGAYQLQLQLLDFDEEKQAKVRAVLSGASAASAEASPPRPAAAKSGGPTTRSRVDLRIEALLKPWEPPAALAESEPEQPEAADSEFETSSERNRLEDQLKDDLSDFTLQLVQAITKTSYYTADHRESDRAKEGLYGAFTKLLRDKPEVTFYLRTAGEKRFMLVYGVFDEPTELSSVMQKQMAEIYTTKLSGYFESNSLLNLSLKRALDEEEFHRFVNLLARPGSLSPGAKTELVEHLAGERIHNISLVFQEDRVGGRRLGWKVQMALTRLRKDLSVIPFYRHLSEEALDKVRMQVFGDVARPLRDVRVLRELLENCDLALDQSDDPSEEKLAELENQVLGAVERDKLPELLQGLASDLAEARDEGGERFEMLQRLTRRVSQQLAADQVQLLEDAFRTLLENDVLAVEELPAFMQQKLALEGKTNAFLEIKEEHLQHFDGARDPADYQRHLDFFDSIFPILLPRRDSSALLEILGRVAAGRTEPAPFEERGAMAEAWFEGLVESRLAPELPQLLQDADRVRREFLLELCRIIGAPVLPTLFSILRESEPGPTRQELHQLVVEFKGPALELVSQELQTAELGADYLRELLELLEQVGQPESASLATELRAHRDPQVRRAALLAACRLDEGRAEGWLVPALVDAQAEIRETARGQLFKRGSTAPAVFEYCSGILNTVEDHPELARHICTDLAVYEQGEGRQRSVALLLGVLAGVEAPKGGWLSKLTGRGTDPAHVHVLIAACLSLGRMRATEAADDLGRLCKCGTPRLEQAADRALKMIREN
jgi:hypothetical protein